MNDVYGSVKRCSFYSRGAEEGALFVGEGLGVPWLFYSLPSVFLRSSMGNRSFTHGRTGPRSLFRVP
eukprot:6573035-Pyramimonas_sp.AAC.1